MQLSLFRRLNVNFFGGSEYLRLISKEWIIKDVNGRQRLSTTALDPSSKDYDQYCGLSVDIENFIAEDGLDTKAFVSTPQFTGSISFTVNTFRSRKFFVGYHPCDDNPYHGAVWKDQSRGSRFTRGTKKSLLKEAEWP
ncbi:MAG: hypothetical protein L0Y39_12905 [Methylococcaceae bacterium]|nr:hypothetical protein [Methylococcaceae bacterium]